MVLECRILKDFSSDVFTQIAAMNPPTKSLYKRSQTQQTKIMQEIQNLREKIEGGESNHGSEERHEINTQLRLNQRGIHLYIVAKVRVHSHTHTSMGKGKEQEKNERNTSQTKKKFKTLKELLPPTAAYPLIYRFPDPLQRPKYP